MTIDVKAVWTQSYSTLRAQEPHSIQNTRAAWQIAQDYLSPKEFSSEFIEPSNKVLDALRLLRDAHATESLLMQFLGRLSATLGQA